MVRLQPYGNSRARDLDFLTRRPPEPTKFFEPHLSQGHALQLREMHSNGFIS